MLANSSIWFETLYFRGTCKRDFVGERCEGQEKPFNATARGIRSGPDDSTHISKQRQEAESSPRSPHPARLLLTALARSFRIEYPGKSLKKLPVFVRCSHGDSQTLTQRPALGMEILDQNAGRFQLFKN